MGNAECSLQDHTSSSHLGCSRVVSQAAATGPHGGVISHNLVLVSVLEIVLHSFAPMVYHGFASISGFSLVPIKS